MKRLSKAIVLVALLIGIANPSWGQASTEGREFWVALLMANSPAGFSGSTFNPFIAISAKKQCKVTVSNPSQGWSQPQRTVNADSWLIIDDIPNDKWYNENWTANSASEVVTKLGIKVEATEDVSVYAAIRMEFSYDASNILPISALQSDYILQDYPTYNSDGHKENDNVITIIPEKQAHSIFTILATEDNTTVAITPSIATINGKAAKERFTVNLNKGETYQVVSSPELSFSGTRITAYDKNDHSAPRAIAVFQGADFTQVPGGKSARDCLYEQAMPVDYWGTEFVVTRSKEKDANRIRITAADNMTDVYIDDNPRPVKQLQPGETWEFEMSENLASTDMAKYITDKKVQREIPPILTGEAHYIKTSCPVAVYCYDVSSGYKFNDDNVSEVVKYGDKYGGDPSMVWISPLQQRISKITFGACGTPSTDTGHTNRHFINIVCLTSDTASVKLSSELRSKIKTEFQTVPGNPMYSYARVFLVDTDGSTVDKVYTLSSKSGVVAHVYGSGLNESYAYSVGSAAVKQGINVNNITFTDGFRDEENKFCVTDSLEFNAKVGNDDITRVDWDFGDGISVENAKAEVKHLYITPGWYDVTAVLYGKQACSNSAEQKIGTVQFSFLVWEPDTLIGSARHECFTLEEYAQNSREIDALIQNSSIKEDERENCYDDVVLRLVTYGKETEETKDEIVGHDVAVGYNGKEYTSSQDVTDTLTNDMNCPHYVNYHIRVITCLEMNIENNPDAQHVCPGEGLEINFTKVKGDIGNARFVVPGRINTAITIDNTSSSGTITLPISSIREPGVYSGTLTVEDANGCETQTFTIDFTVNYPSDIFALKYNNVLAVYKPGYGGNSYRHSFSDYQWYYNDAPINGATSSTYHTDGKLPSGSYYVVLTRTGSVAIPSCPLEIRAEELPDFDEEQSGAPAKFIRNNRMCIIVGERIYDIYGQRVQ